jgi:hypothetical protein
VTHLRKIMLEELQRRHYSQGTTRYYVRHVERFARHFNCSPDRLGLTYVQTPLFLPTPLRRNTCAEKMPTKLMMSSPIASGQKTKAPVTKMGLTYWFLR